MSLLEQAAFIRNSVRNLNRYFEKSIVQKVEKSGITVPQMRVIKEVVSSPGISVKQLTHNLQMTQSTVSDIVERLVKNGLLVKASNPSDKRSVLIHPSSNVTRFLNNDSADFVNETALKTLERLTRKEQETVIQSFRILLRAIETQGEVDPR